MMRRAKPAPFICVSRTNRGPNLASAIVVLDILRPFRLDLGPAAVNEQFDPRDETGVIRSQKQRHLSNFLGLPHAFPLGWWTQSAQSRLRIADSPAAY